MDSKQKLIQCLKQFQDEYGIYPQLATEAGRLCYRLEKIKLYPAPIEQFMRQIQIEFKTAGISSNLTEVPADHFGPHYVFGIGSRIHFKVPIRYSFENISDAINRAASVLADADSSLRITFRPSYQSDHQLCAYIVQGELKNLEALAKSMHLTVIPIRTINDPQIEAQLVSSKPLTCLGKFITILQELKHAADNYGCIVDINKHMKPNNSYETLGINKIERTPHCLATLPNFSVDTLHTGFVGLQARFADFGGDILVCTHQHYIDCKEADWKLLGFFIPEAKQGIKNGLQQILKFNIQDNGFNLNPDFAFVPASVIFTVLNSIANIHEAELTPSPDLHHLLQWFQEQQQREQQLD